MRIFANAKINLTLDITGKRGDGYHLIDSVFQSVSVADIISVEKDKDIKVLCQSFLLGGADISGENNIAFTAAKEFFGATGISGGARITIEKYIPVCAGMGGGSADAAAVITALNSIYKTGLSREALTGIALKCGADVPFFLFGGTARVRGIGEDVTPLNFLGKYYVLIVKSGDKKSTADMYKRLDLMPRQNPVTGEFADLLKEGKTADALRLSANAFSRVCEDNGITALLKSQNPVAVSLSGSGPAHFAVFNNEKVARAAAQKLQSEGISSIVAAFESKSLKAE